MCSLHQIEQRCVLVPAKRKGITTKLIKYHIKFRQVPKTSQEQLTSININYSGNLDAKQTSHGIVELQQGVGVLNHCLEPRDNTLPMKKLKTS